MGHMAHLRKQFKSINTYDNIITLIKRKKNTFRNHFPCEKGGVLYLNKTESPSPKDALCQVWLKLAQWFWRRRFLNIFNMNLHFRKYLPLKKGVTLNSFEQI